MPEVAVSDGLVVSGGGTSVVTEELDGAAVQLEVVAREASGIATDLLAVDRLLSWGDLAQAPLEARRAEHEIDCAIAAFGRAEAQSRVLAWSLARAADGYGAVESGARQVLDGVLGGLGGVVGMLAPVLLPGAALATATIALLSPDDRNRLLSNPFVVAAIRAGVMTVDDAIMGRAGIPGAIAGALGEDGLGVTGVPFSAGVIGILGGAIGALRSSDVRVVREQPLPTVSAPAGYLDRLDRIPEPDALGGAQVVIEKYEMPDGEIRAEVYIAGTVDFDPWAQGEPWDMASNIANAVGGGGGSYDAVVAAMADAGLDASTPVQFTGYSQGAGTAARLVESGQFDARGLLTFGGPTGQIALPESVPTVIVEHDDDLVAALGGRQDNTHAVVVQRYATEGMDFEGSELMPGHRLTGYLETARRMDASDDDDLRAAAQELSRFTEGGVLVSSTAYECDRVSASS